MAKSRIVGSGELRSRFGHYLRLVRRGETILVTGRRGLVAELRPVPVARGAMTTTLRKLAATGAVTLPMKSVLSRFQPIRTSGMSASAAVSSDRNERG